MSFKFMLILGVSLLLSAPALAQSLVRGPYLQMQTDDGITIHWRTDSATDSVVHYGTVEGVLDQAVVVGGSRTDHAVALVGLGANTKYWYSVGHGSTDLASGSTYHFSTAPVAGIAADTRVWVLGDSGTANASALAVRDAYKAWSASNPADLLLMLGDNAYSDGTDAEYQAAVFDTYPEILRQLPVWSTLGNHDGHSADSGSETGPYYDIFNLPDTAQQGGYPSYTEAYYSFDYANIHFVCLDSYETSRAPTGAMMQWLQADLMLNTQPWVIAFWHHPPYSKGSHDSDTESQLIDMRQNALPLLESWGVDLVLTGHSHSYERSMLIDGHYGSSGTFDPVVHALDTGSGQVGGDGAYEKPDLVAAENYGAVYAVAGSSGKISGGSLDHPAMYIALNLLGSMVLDISGNRLDAVFLDNTGAVEDSFTIVKTPDDEPPLLVAATATDAGHVRVEFNETLDSVEAGNASNYAIAGLSVSQASLVNGDRDVELTTSTMTAGAHYTLVVNGVQDLALNTIAADSSIGFDFFERQTVAFQDGLAPDPSYDGTSDAYIREYSPDTNYGLSASLQVDGDDPGGSTNDMNILLRWDTGSIPAGAIAESATVQMEVTNVSAGAYACRPLLRAWDQSEVTWNLASAGNAWGSPGAEAASDRDNQVVCTISAGSTGTMLMDIDLGLVQAWIDDPSGNHGIVISDPSITNGADFHSSESGTAMARPKLEITYRVPVGPPANIPPTADFTFDCTDLDCSFSDTSGDSDGSVVTWSWDFGDGTSSSAQNPSHGYAVAGDYTVELTVDDDDGDSDTHNLLVSVTEPVSTSEYLAQADLPSAGSVSGSYNATHGDDGNVQSITERVSGGKKNSRYSYLSHTWRFEVGPGTMTTLHANAWSGGSSEGDDFRFEWSSDNSSFSELFVVSSTDPANLQSAVIPASGTLYIRVTDTDRSARNTALDTVYVDHLVIESDSTPVTDAPPAPTNLSVSSTTSSSINLAWDHDDNSELSFDLQRMPAGSSWSTIDNPPGGSNSYSDTGLPSDATFTYRLRAVNSVGASAWSNEVTGSTKAAAAITLAVNARKVKGKHVVDLDWSGASSGSVDIIRDNTVQATRNGNSGSWTDNTGNKGARTYVYRVCEAGADSCSDDQTVVY